jgi:hypothetical protein
MVWIYDSPFNSDEQKAYIGLRKELRKDHIAKRTIKLLSLVAFLRKSGFKTIEEIQKSAYYDQDRTRPIFDKESAKQVLKKLKQRGGRTETNFPFFDTVIKDGLNYVVPDSIKDTIVSTHETYIKNPIDNIKNWAPVLKIITNALHSGTSAATNAIDSVGDLAGPAGSAMATPFIALASLPSLATAFAEADIGQMAVNALTIVPIIGDPASNAIKQGESIIKTAVDSESDLPTFIPYVGDYIVKKRSEKIEDAQKLASTAPTAGKRFLTQRNRYNKWKRTRRNKSAKI